MSSSKPILVSRILEYSTILLLNYFQDTLAYVGIPEAWLEFDPNDVTLIKTKYVQLESNQVIETEPDQEIWVEPGKCSSEKNPMPIMLLPLDKLHITVQGHESEIVLTEIVTSMEMPMTET